MAWRLLPAVLMRRFLGCLRHVLPAVIVVVLAGHFAVTLLYLTPLNPIKLALLDQVNGYMTPHFEQRWELFAPDLPADTRYLLIGCRLDDGTVTPWSNTTAALRDLTHRFRLSPADRLDRASQGAFHVIFQRPDLVEQKLRDQDHDDPAVKALIERMDGERASRIAGGERLLRRVASAECDRLHGRGRTRAVRARMVVVKSPPFSRRDAPDDALETHYVDWDFAAHEEVSP